MSTVKGMWVTGVSRYMPDEESSFEPPIQQVLAYPTRVQILGALAEATKPLSPAEVLSHANISSPSYYEHKDELIDLELVELVDVDGEDHVQLTDTAGADAIVALNRFLGDQLAQQGEVESEISELLQ